MQYAKPGVSVPGMPQKAILAIVATVVLLAVGVGVYLYWTNYKSATEGFLKNVENTAQDITDSATKGVLPSIQTNPLENKPDVNPADKANPFTDIKTNPF